ncbi:hypothetical protein [Actinomadura kijaniata]|uniref:hypothetical protein n=1 Tax=Actinomadura kijaniata TaxID=46161 RepID=UPI000B1F5459|nr:hypothetical protein [Actinomadura kijaniata]
MHITVPTTSNRLWPLWDGSKFTVTTFDRFARNMVEAAEPLPGPSDRKPDSRTATQLGF